MKPNRLKLSALLLFGIAFMGIHAQENTNASGGNATGEGGSVSYSVGQLVHSTYSESTGSIAEGLQQPFEISVVTGIKPTNGIHLLVSAYPNPTTGMLTLSIKDYELSGLSFKLYDINGNLLQNKKITDKQGQINMSGLASATYFLKVIQENKEIKAFKIIKIQ
jgi:hypothetical protein